MTLALTENAERRAQQRRNNRHLLTIIAEMADRSTHVGSGVVYKYVTRKRIDQLRGDGLDATTCEKLSRTSLLLDADTGDIITVLKGGYAARIMRFRLGRRYHINPPANDNLRW